MLPSLSQWLPYLTGYGEEVAFDWVISTGRIGNTVMTSTWFDDCTRLSYVLFAGSMLRSDGSSLVSSIICGSNGAWIPFLFWSRKYVQALRDHLLMEIFPIPRKPIKIFGQPWHHLPTLGMTILGKKSISPNGQYQSIPLDHPMGKPPYLCCAYLTDT